MHYCVLLFTKELPSEEKIAEIMHPYYEGNAEYDEETEKRLNPYPVFEWDWYQIGGRYKGSLKLSVERDKEYYNFGYYSREDRNKRLFYSSLLSDMKEFAEMGNAPSWKYSEEDYLNSLGYRDRYLYVDGARVDDIINFAEQNCYICIDVDGNAIARETWNGKEFIKDEQFDEKLAEIKRNSKGIFLTVLDIHD